MKTIWKLYKYANNVFRCFHNYYINCRNQFFLNFKYNIIKIVFLFQKNKFKFVNLLAKVVKLLYTKAF